MNLLAKKKGDTMNTVREKLIAAGYTMDDCYDYGQFRFVGKEETTIVEWEHTLTDIYGRDVDLFDNGDGYYDAHLYVDYLGQYEPGEAPSIWVFAEMIDKEVNNG